MNSKDTWFDNVGALHNITNDDAGIYDVSKINKLLKGSLGNMEATKKG